MPVGHKTKARNWLRAYGGVSRVAWVQNLPSVATGKFPCVNAHVKNGGLARKADYRWIIPLTYEEHQALHLAGRRAFEDHYGINLEVEAQRIQRLWEEYERVRDSATP